MLIDWFYNKKISVYSYSYNSVNEYYSIKQDYYDSSSTTNRLDAIIQEDIILSSLLGLQLIRVM